MGNSVIYRPAYDAEVEYLESTGTQWIDTGIVPDDTCGFYIRAYLTQLSSSRNQKCVGAGTFQNNNRFWVNFSFSRKLEISWNTYEEEMDYSDNTWYEITNNYLNSRIGTIDGITKRTDYPTLNTIKTSTRIFDVDGDTFAGRISNVRISKGSEIIRDFIPVRIGSVGYLYDKVSKQLFANKGTGNFILGNDVSNAVIPQQRCVLYFGSQRSVVYERIYEEYEWLCGRNGAYIDTRYVPIPTEDFFMFKINNNGFWKNPNNDDPHVFGVYSPRIRFGTFASAKNRYFFQYSNVMGGAAPYFTSSDYIQEVTLLNDGIKTKCIANGIESEYETTITEQFNDSIWLYAINNAPSKYFHGDVAYFKITDTSSNTKMNLVPCKLLQSIPAILDGNGIARQAGECGMWDKVSGRFYGNVASSGTFSVSND